MEDKFNFWYLVLRVKINSIISDLSNEFGELVELDYIEQLARIYLFKAIKKKINVQKYVSNNLKYDLSIELDRETTKINDFHKLDNISKDIIDNFDFSNQIENNDYYKYLFENTIGSIWARAGRERMYFQEIMCDYTGEYMAFINGISADSYCHSCCNIRKKYQKKFPQVKEILKKVS